MFFHALGVFLKILSLPKNTCMFIERQPRCYPWNNPERNWRSRLEPVPPRIIIYNKIVHLKNLNNILTINNINRIDLHKMLLCLIQTERKNIALW